MAATTEKAGATKAPAKVSKIAWPMRIAASVHQCRAEELAEKITAAGINVTKVTPGYVYFSYKVPHTVNNHFEAAELINKQFLKKWPKSKALVPL